MIHIDAKYISLVSARLGKFKRTKNNLYTFRCPYCGDSKKNKNKTRGYLQDFSDGINDYPHYFSEGIEYWVLGTKFDKWKPEDYQDLEFQKLQCHRMLIL